jgi:hypothetical protein
MPRGLVVGGGTDKTPRAALKGIPFGHSHPTARIGALRDDHAQVVGGVIEAAVTP